MVGGADPTTGTTQARDCVRVTGGTATIDTGAVATDAISLSGEIFVCAHDVVVVGEAELYEVAAAAQLAAALRAPLLFPHTRLAAEIGRLHPDEVHLVGDLEFALPPGVVVRRYGVTEAVGAAAEALGTEEAVTTATVPDAEAIVEVIRAIDAGDRVAGPAMEPPPGTAPAIDVPTLVRGLARSGDGSALWVIDATSPVTILFASAAVHAVGASVVAVDGADLLGYPELASALEDLDPGAIRWVGGAPAGGEWEMAALINGRQLPGGGFQVLPGDAKRRYLAFYGHPEAGALGALGQQDGPGSTVERMRPFIEAYQADGHQVIPTFEMIATVAAAGPTPDGNYSTEWSVDTFRPWVDFAADNDMYVVLDLQPGRDDFLTQARLYEELLLEPHVGLALDPEWRLAPDQVHLQQVGRVDATEVNQVLHWLADLVRDNGLPQKMLIVHQFRLSMIQNRELLEERPEIQLIIQMDGEGTEAQKDSTWQTLLQDTEGVPWAWGWKNFFVRDPGGPPSPESTMGKEPTPVFVSYQ